MVANLANTKWCKKTEKRLKPWHIGNHLRVLSDCFSMNANMTGIRWISKIFWSLCFGWKYPQHTEQDIMWIAVVTCRSNSKLCLSYIAEIDLNCCLGASAPGTSNFCKRMLNFRSQVCEWKYQLSTGALWAFSFCFVFIFFFHLSLFYLIVSQNASQSTYLSNFLGEMPMHLGMTAKISW